MYGFRWIFSCHALHSCDSVFDYPRSRVRSVEWMTSRCVSDEIHSLLGRCPRFCHPSGRARRSGFSGGIRTDLVPGAPCPPRGLILLVPDSHHGGVYAACRILDHGRAEIGDERDLGVVCLVLHVQRGRPRRDCVRQAPCGVLCEHARRLFYEPTPL